MSANTVRKVEKGADKLAKKASKSGRQSFAGKVQNLGKLELEIKYSHETLSVYLGQAKGLQAKDTFGSSDPYAKVYLLHSNPSALFVKDHENTKTHKKNLNPFFNDTFEFKGINRSTLLDYKLVIALWDKDMIGNDEYMAGIRVSMSHFSFDGKGHLALKFWADLQPHFVDGHPLEVTHATIINYINQEGVATSNSARRDSSSSSSSSDRSSVQDKKKKPSVLERLNATVTFTVSFDPNGFLRIQIIRAQGLPDKDLIGKSDPYAKIYLLDGNNSKFVDHNKKLKTRTMKNNQNPDFHEGFEFKMILQMIRNMRTVIEIWDDDFGKDQFLAGVMFNMSSFNLSSEVELTVSLYSGLDAGLPFLVDDVMRFAVKKHSSVVHKFSTVETVSKKKSVWKMTSGTVTFTISYDANGFLILHIIRAQGLPDKDMIGKSDPYAKIYLLSSDNSKFLDHNKKQKTKTVKNNQNPEFNESFQFKLSLQMIRNMRAVIEFWDDDFGKDQYLVGVMFSMGFFLSSDVELELSLYAGQDGGLPFMLEDVKGFQRKSYNTRQTVQVKSKSNQKPRSRSSSSSSSSSSSDDEKADRFSLRANNNKLVSYIEKARILAQAQGIGSSIPDSINVNENVRGHQTQDIQLNAQFQDYLVPAIKNMKEKVRNAEEELARLREKNRKMNLYYDERTQVLSDKDRAIWSLENDLMQIQGKCNMLQYEITRVKEMEVSLDGEREYYIEQMAEAKRAMGAIDVNVFKREIETKRVTLEGSFHVETEEEIEKRMSEVNIPIKVYTTFKERMLKELKAKRKLYLQSVGKLQIESKQIMAMYDNIVSAKEKGSLSAHRKTSMMEKIGFYRADMSGIEVEVEKLRLELSRLQGDHARKQGEFEIELRNKHSEFEAFRRKFEADLQAWFAKYGAEFNAWCREQLELSIYDKLLEFEEKRIASASFSRPEMATVTINKKRASYATGPRTHSSESSRSYSTNAVEMGSQSNRSSRSGYEYASAAAASGGRTSYSSSYASKARKESGYHSPGTKTPGNKTPEGTLERHSGYSDVFKNIEQEEFSI